jgi:hypothetical protein
MRQVIWTDRTGCKRISLVRDTDPDEAAEQGIPCGPPDLDLIDWEEVKKEINNYLVERKCLTWLDVQRNQNVISHAVRKALVGRIVYLFRQEAIDE